MLQLLQGLRNNVDSVPSHCRRDFTNGLEALLHAAADGNTRALSALTIAVGPIYPDPTLPRPSAAEIASLAYAHQQQTPHSSADSRRSTTDTVLQSFERASDETAFLARPAFGKPGYKTDASRKDARDSRKDDYSLSNDCRPDYLLLGSSAPRLFPGPGPSAFLTPPC